VAFVGIDTNDTDDSKALAMLRAAGADFPVGVDSARDTVTDAYGAVGLPTTFFLDRSGHVVYEVLGAQNIETLDRRLEALINTGNSAAGSR